ncbi:hypothetical protein M2263_000184 [Providencia alcalifaciens]|nr:hypothetical protein [Providencia alcalifaciens]
MSFSLSDIRIYAPVDGIEFSDEFPNVEVLIYSGNVSHKLHLFINDIENKTVKEITEISAAKLKMNIKDYL